ncbi:nucleoside permease [Francisella persica ATCC VR-331]|uniref:Nucleoside permease n=1 Tax=Francisella persica ATCC VR-331 TaxID=1086726 RepID=A0AAC8ZMB8_9GAMM|nr:nucleoside transporter C-terminal domain-containing protein [Francisella persica]ALB01248.1 nucleoside permease [Francisella persica ATCC VR-331]ANH77538.1 nucleoside permease [Francisella persica ATCC VR-331]
MVIKSLYFILGLIVIYFLAYVWSNNRKNIRYKNLIIILIIQLILAKFMLSTSIGINIINYVNKCFEILLDSTRIGVSFVFGHLANTKEFIFFFDAAMPIVVMSAVIGILQYFMVLQFLVVAVGSILSKVTGMGKLESFNAVSSLTVGQQENFLIYKKIIGHLPANVLYTMAATAMSTVSLTIAGSYMSIIEPKYVCTAIVLNMLSTFFVLHIINPYDKDHSLNYDTLHADYETCRQSFFEMLSEYILDGFKVAIIVCVMIIGYIALLNLVDGIFQEVLGVTFRQILGYIFYPVAWILNIHGNEIFLSSQIMGTKIVTNEFVAMQELAKNSQQLSEHTKAVVSVFLVSFANFSSIGIIVGAVQALNKEASIKVARFSLKILYGAVLVSILSACVVGFIV